MKIALLMAVWLVSWFLMWGVMLSHLQRGNQYGEKFNKSFYRRDLSFSLLFSSVPVISFIFIIALTGFCENGWVNPITYRPK